MSLASLLNLASVPESEGFLPRHVGDALHGAQTLKEHPRFYWKLGREDATLFSYALYNILSRDSHHQPESSRYQAEAEGVIKGLEKAYPTLEETITRDRAGSIIFNEKEKIDYYTRDFQRATAEEKLHLYLLQQADRGHLLRKAMKIYRAFANGGFGPLPVEMREDNK